MRPTRRTEDLPEAANAMLATIAAWQREHSRATLSEIEDAVDTQVAGLRQRIVEAHLAAHELADDAPAQACRICPGCGGRLRAHGRKTRRLTTHHGGALDLDRTYWWCPRCRAGLFPPGSGVGAGAGAVDPAGA